MTSMCVCACVAAGSAAIPISDIRGVESLNYSKAEKVHRCKTASLYRLADLFGMASASNGLITVRHCCASSPYVHVVGDMMILA